jgi:glycosyltransferase involved in cell wall biosynthesis
VDIVIPVYNEEAALESSVRRVCASAEEALPVGWRVTIADNASMDSTQSIGERLAGEIEAVRYLRLDQKGRGRALRTAWLSSESVVLVYMDVDLSTDLRALLPLVAPLLTGHSAIAIGSRLKRGARVARGPKREYISRIYNRLLRVSLRVGFSDAQCGFKAIRRDVACQMLPSVADQGWFFDTELLVLAERLGLRIYEVPVDWTDDLDSRVHVVDTAMKDLQGMWRIRSRRAHVEHFRRSVAEMEKSAPSSGDGIPARRHDRSSARLDTFGEAA